ncbi:GntR family transcriptional regulator [Haloactinomyces albus]|uniref:DNA-binding GntR family transcriptional regulator n=1 Tax=Haloactinomyces albus TaxID=1352928 RepID=A0AAE3ZET4_9ACTN|nr:GntR family transcriptional regulator [Haloactinomyces albus]MDR7303621.1 DNA-binding GntR family transcriptional regulator [Haloactinomyces albus]
MAEEEMVGRPERLSKSQRAYQTIKSRITEGDYGPGHRLVLGRLARELEVSPVPIREAIRLLEAEGFVEFERNVGAQVSAINPVEYAHTMEMLAIVEGAATGLAAPHITAEVLATATEINDRMRTTLRDFDPRGFTHLNHEFHEALFTPCPNPYLLDMVRRGWTRLASIRESSFSFVPGRAEESVAEHDRLLELLRGGADPAEVEQAARAHRTATMTAFLSREHHEAKEG